ncbi:MAG: DUF6171 family protein [Lachnospiraceae bacterium]|nr:DUF6171 family protein [Lachnospiraceae bacterium]
MTPDNQIICKKCIIEKIDQFGILESVRKRVELMPKEDKVSDEEYVRRLQICVDCKNLNLGTCNICGCFVEYRAALIDMHCPDTKPGW